MSCTTSFQYASSTEEPEPISSENCAVYSSPVSIAFWKIDGLEVMPRTPRSIHCWISPDSSHARLRLSSHGLWPSNS